MNATRKFELDLYLDEAQLALTLFKKLEVLNYWQDCQHRYPNLARIAYDVLSIPIITIATESAFSIGGCVLIKYRCCILPDNVQALILTHNWLNSFDPLVNFCSFSFDFNFYLLVHF